MYKLDDQEAWPENGSINYNTIPQLMLFCRRRDKWDKVPYVDTLFSLLNNHEVQRKCGLMNNDANGVYVLADNGKKKQRWCSACDIGKGYIRKSEEEEDAQMSVAKPNDRQQDLESESDSSKKKKEGLYPGIGYL